VPAAARLSLASCAVAAALTLPACGGGSDAATTSSGGTAPTSRTTNAGDAKPAKKEGPPNRAPAGDLCQSQVGGFLGSMDSLRRRLAVGVTYGQYVDEVHGVRSTYRDVPVEELRLDCLNAVGVPGEKALNRYIEAADDWGDCISELGCGSASVEPVLQKRWRGAAHFLAQAQQGLRQIEG
jgi:hypothetical protein